MRITHNQSVIATSSNGSQPAANAELTPNNVNLAELNPALLKFCLQHTDSSAVVDRAPPNRSPEDLKWLQKVLGDIQTPGERVDKLLAQLTSPETAVNELVLLLEQLQSYAEDIDQAEHLARVASPAIVALLPHADAEVRRWAAFVVAECSHQSAGQVSMRAAGAVNAIIQRMDAEDDQSVRAKLITAASALSGTDEGAAEFVDNNGVERLSRFVLESTLASTRAKTMFFAAKLCRLSETARAQVIANGQSGHNDLVAPAVAALAENGISSLALRTNAARLLAQLVNGAADNPAVLPLLKVRASSHMAFRVFMRELQSLRLAQVVDAVLADIGVDAENRDAREQEAEFLQRIGDAMK